MCPWCAFLPNLGVHLDFQAEDDPISLMHDRYAIAVKLAETGQKIGHVPQFISRFIFHFMRRGGHVTGAVSGAREFSWDLPQGGLQIPVSYTFRCEDRRLLTLFVENILRLVNENMI